MRRTERPILQLPRPLLAGFVLVFACQLGAHQLLRVQDESGYEALRAPFSASTYQGIAMGSEQLLAYLLAIRLQLHDSQAGQYYSYSRIDYRVLRDWLEQITQLDASSEYPMLLASRVYSQTEDKKRLRLMLDFIVQNFDRDPQLHWRRLAEASVLAKHKLGDLNMALRMAEKLASQPDSLQMPQWARDMRFLLLAELNELESAIAIIQALLQSDAINDPDEKRFLLEKLSSFQQKLSESQHISQ